MCFHTTAPIRIQLLCKLCLSFSFSIHLTILKCKYNNFSTHEKSKSRYNPTLNSCLLSSFYYSIHILLVVHTFLSLNFNSFSIPKRITLVIYTSLSLFLQNFYISTYVSGGPYLSFALFLQCFVFQLMFLVVRTFLSPYFFSALYFNLYFWRSVPLFRLIYQSNYSILKVITLIFSLIYSPEYLHEGTIFILCPTESPPVYFKIPSFNR